MNIKQTLLACSVTALVSGGGVHFYDKEAYGHNDYTAMAKQLEADYQKDRSELSELLRIDFQTQLENKIQDIEHQATEQVKEKFAQFESAYQEKVAEAEAHFEKKTANVLKESRGKYHEGWQVLGKYAVKSGDITLSAASEVLSLKFPDMIQVRIKLDKPVGYPRVYIDGRELLYSTSDINYSMTNGLLTLGKFTRGSELKITSDKGTRTYSLMGFTAAFNASTA
ncbi:hypothetical protein [Vibrio europaeus]|uniref:hypothetical protein n=1 Tax=Vibrio europaeus TaxID=300876 RepID=UPI00148DB22C|nr:hypothetical protein [Vibrio europaeus]NOH23864.1 hypothetical protein [Vibrio europaeus]